MIVEIKDLYKKFNNFPVLDGVNLTLQRGENLGILGKSGVGKSVLAKCIVRLVEPDSGSIRVFGNDILNISSKKLNEVRREMGYLFQGGALYDSMTVRENMEFPIIRNEKRTAQHEIDERVEKALRSVGLLDAIDKMPAELSGGMKKRIGLARALILNPKLMLYDEPTTGLDSVTSGEISELILKVQEEYDTSSIIITHDMKCAELTTNRVALLYEGKFIAEGTFDELKNSSDNRIRPFFYE